MLSAFKVPHAEAFSLTPQLGPKPSVFGGQFIKRVGGDRLRDTVANACLAIIVVELVSCYQDPFTALVHSARLEIWRIF